MSVGTDRMRMAPLSAPARAGQAYRAGVDAGSVFTLAWMAAVAFFVAAVALFLLDRLGVGARLLGTMVVTVGALFVVLGALRGRTMTGAAFFHARRSAGVPLTGISGMADVTGGAFLALFFVLPDAGRAILVPAVLAGVATGAFAFATAFQHARVATVPGFLAWRAGRQTPGLLTLPTVLSIAVCLGVAELRVGVTAGASLTGYDEATVMAGLLVMALLPVLVGGWQALVLANMALVLCALIATVGPAALTGLAPGLATAPLLRETEALAAISFQPSLFVPAASLGEPGVLVALAFIVFLGTASLPGAVGRYSLQPSGLAVLHGTGFTVLAQFLVLSALPLSLALAVSGGVTAPQAVDSLAEATRQHPALTILPRTGLLFLSFNALSATLLWSAAALVRAVRRSRRRDPGERSMVPTRGLAVAFALALPVVSGWLPLAPADLFIAALALSAAGLFVPLLATSWMKRLPNWALGLAVLVGPLPVALALAPHLGLPPPLPALRFGLASAVAGGLCAGLAVILAGMGTALARRGRIDPPAADLRDPERAQA